MPMSLSLSCLLRTAAMMASASFGNSGQLSVECVGSSHTVRIDVARDGNVNDDDGVSYRVNKDVGLLTTNSDGDFDRCRHDRLGDVKPPASTTLAFLSCQLFLSGCFTVAIGFPACEALALPLCITSTYRALEAISVRSACVMEGQYSRRL